MDHSNGADSRSRRHFLRDASLMAVAASGLVGGASNVVAETASDELDEANVVDQANAIDLGLKPALQSCGAVIVQKANAVFVTFVATGPEGEGTAIVKLAGCVSFASHAGRCPAPARHSVDIDQLGVCEFYEVANSSWVESLSPANSETDSDAGASETPQLQHYIITFFGIDPGVSEGAPHFECLAESIDAQWVSTGPFEEVLDYIDYLDASS